MEAIRPRHSDEQNAAKFAGDPSLGQIGQITADASGIVQAA